MKALAGRLLSVVYKGLVIILIFLFFFFSIKQVLATEFNIDPGNTEQLINSINSANSNSEVDTINLAINSTYELTTINNNTYSNNGLPVIKTEITINGNGSTIIRNSASNFRILSVIAQGNLTLNNLKIENGYDSDSSNDYGGGGVFNLNGSLFINESIIKNNMANVGGGGGIWLGGNTTTKIIKSKISNNHVNAPGSGGALLKRGLGLTEIINSEIADNYAQNVAGGIYFGNNLDGTSGGLITVDHTIFVNNSTQNTGGAIYNHSGNITVSSSCFSNNKSVSVLNNPSAPRLSAQSNFWGSSSGPSGVGPGTGDSVSTNVDFSNWLTSCPPLEPSPSPSPTPSPNPSPLPSPSPSPSSSPSLIPIVILPGFGGSWNSAALISGQNIGVWKKTPFVKVYDNLRATLLTRAGYTEGENYFEFYYDWRQPIINLDDKLNEFINNTVLLGKPESTKVNLVGHSLGGLVARAYGQTFGPEKINRLVTLGSPHEGAIPAYLAWQGAEVGDKWSWSWLAFQLYLHTHQNLYSSPVSAVQGLGPSLKDILPIFDFTHGVPVTPTNDYLTNLKNDLSGELKNITTTISGHDQNTLEYITFGPRTVADKLLNRWPDGRPIAYEYYQNGDQTVLEKSALIDGANPTQVAGSHQEIVESAAGLGAILKALGIDAQPVIETASPPLYPSLVFWLHSPAQIKVTLPSGTSIGPNEDNLLVIPGAADGVYKLEILGTGTGNYTLDIGQLTQNQELWSTLTDSVTPHQIDNFNLNFNASNPLPHPIVDESGYAKLEQAKARLDQLKLKSKLLPRQIDQIILRLKNNQYYPALELLIPTITNAYSSGLTLADADSVGQLLVETYAQIGQVHGYYLTAGRVDREITSTVKTKTATENKLKNLTDKPRTGQLLDLADKYLARSQNNSNLYHRSADALVARILYSQANALR